MRLREVLDRHDSDKGRIHGYERVYEPLFAARREEPLRILEIGVLRGASVAAWLEYFPNAEVIAIDTFERVPAEEVPVLSDARVNWYRMDSTREKPAIDPVDVVIDDGYHTSDAQLATFRNYFPLIKEGGVYFIEDCPPLETGDYGRLMGYLGQYTVRQHALGGRWKSTIVEIRHG